MKEKIKELPIKKFIPVAIIVLIIIVLVAVLVSCGKNDNVDLTDEEAATLVLDDGDEAWIQEYLSGDTGLHKSGNVEGVDNKTATSSEGNLISWEPVKDAVAYKVFRAESKDGKYECIATVTETSYLDKDTDGKQYYYKTTAIKQGAVKTTKPNDSKNSTAANNTEDTNAAQTPSTDSAGTTAVPPEENGTTKPSTGGTTASGGGTGDLTKPDETTTITEETTTEKVIPSAPSYTPSQKDARNVRAVFEANVRSTSNAKSLAQLCANKLGTVALGWGQSPASVSNGKIIALKSKSISGFTECYKFTKDPTTLNGVKMIGYVFKLADGVDPAEFTASLKADAISDYRTGSSSLTKVFSVTEVTTDYYDNYVLFMVTG